MCDMCSICSRFAASILIVSGSSVLFTCVLRDPKCWKEPFFFKSSHLSGVATHFLADQLGTESYLRAGGRDPGTLLFTPKLFVVMNVHPPKDGFDMQN